MKRLLFIAGFLFGCFSANARTDELTTEIIRRVSTFSTSRVLDWADSVRYFLVKPSDGRKQWRPTLDSSQLIGEYWEIKLTFIVTRKNSGEKTDVVHLVSRGNEIVSVHVDNTSASGEPHVFYDSTSQVRWDLLSDAWEKAYGVELKKSAFLGPADAYGDACGYVAIPPIRRKFMLEYVEKRDVASLTAWLQSPIPDKQCYAVEGFFLLKKAGLALTEDQLAMIREAQKRQALVTRCAGCIYGLERQDSILGGFSF